jgi:hypothetical protein
MNLELNISSTIQEKLNHFAAITGKSVGTLIAEAVEERFAAAALPVEANPAKIGTSDWIGALREWSNSHPTRLAHIDDSRDVIYESKGY